MISTVSDPNVKWLSNEQEYHFCGVSVKIPPKRRRKNGKKSFCNLLTGRDNRFKSKGKKCICSKTSVDFDYVRVNDRVNWHAQSNHGEYPQEEFRQRSVELIAQAKISNYQETQRMKASNTGNSPNLKWLPRFKPHVPRQEFRKQVHKIHSAKENLEGLSQCLQLEDMRQNERRRLNRKAISKHLMAAVKKVAPVYVTQSFP